MKVALLYVSLLIVIFSLTVSLISNLFKTFAIECGQFKFENQIQVMFYVSEWQHQSKKIQLFFYKGPNKCVSVQMWLHTNILQWQFFRVY